MSTLLVMAGGTGGHVFPALAVARNLRERGVEVVWLGTHSGLEAKTVPAAGFDIEWINIKGARGKGLLGWLRAPFMVLAAVIQTIGIVLRRRPGALLGMGGFVAGPGGIAAWLLRIPLLIHEANALAGLTNRLLAKMATRILTGFPGTFAKSTREECVGNPVRAEIAALAPPAQRLTSRTGPLRLLIVGGSQGAQALNVQLPEIIHGLSAECDLEVWHQSGQKQQAKIDLIYRELGVNARVSAFIQDMAQAYDWADMVVCRAGAMTVAEVSAAGVAAVFIPFPHAVGDHQTVNANYLVSQQAAYLVAQDRLAADLPEILSASCRQRSRLISVSERARALAKPHATRAVADICMETLDA